MGAFKPLEGLKVVEWTSFIAAPTCGRMLADWGADVIKVETPEGDYWRTFGPKLEVPASDDENPLFDITNANKRGITLNLRSAEGREILEKLVSQADVMITNNRERILKKLGFDYESVSRRYPGIVYAHISGYGDLGPEANRPGYDAATFWAHGGFFADMPLDEPGQLPMHLPAAFGDVAAGSMLFGAIMAALNVKYRTGKGDKVSVSLYGQALWFMGMMHTISQPKYGYRYPRRRDDALPNAAPYRCKDGRWIMVAAAQFARDFPRLCHALELDELAADPRYASYETMMLDENRVPLLRALEARFLEKTAEEWHEILEAQDLVNDIFARFSEVYENEQASANHFIEEVTFRNGEKAWLPRPCIVSENLGVPEYRLAPLMGEHSEEIIASLGYSREEIDRMHREGVFYGTERKASADR